MASMDMALSQWSMVTGDEAKNKMIGMFTHIAVMSGIVFVAVHAARFGAFDVTDSNAWSYGLIFGADHRNVAGTAMVRCPPCTPA
jgi:hypothetical protein